MKYKITFSAILILFFCNVSGSMIEDLGKKDYLPGSGMGYPVRKIEKVFFATEKRANFTVFDGISDVSVEDGKLRFKITRDSVLLGWGNLFGWQAIKDIQDTFQECFEVVLKVKQSSKSNWSVKFYRDGISRPILPRAISTIADKEGWQEVTFKHPNPERPGISIPDAKFDAMEFTIYSDPGTQFEIEWVKLLQPKHEGYCRKEFEIPEGKIWRAIANVGSMNYRNWYGRDEMWSTLYINGEKVEREGALDIYYTSPVDIAPYLKPGKNCVGFYGSRISYSPFLYIHTKIIMESGEVIEFTSGTDWKYSHEEQAGWSETGFDDSSWKAEMNEGYGPWIQPRDPAGDIGIPAYIGRLIIKNPYHKDLYYNNENPVRVNVYIPVGLKEKISKLSYSFGKSDSDGITTSVLDGDISKYQEFGNNIVFPIDFGKQDDGIYTVALSLEDKDGNTIEERPREPIIVLKKLDLKSIKGTTRTEGLDLELEDVIDFTDSGDPHTWIELPSTDSEPIIKPIDNSSYREVIGNKRGAGFSYDFEFKHPGSFYYLELEYPDNEQRIIEVVIKSNADAKSQSSSQAGVGAETGGRFLPTGKMQTLSWIHVADPGPHTLDVVNAMDNEKAAAKSLKIYRIKGNLPSIDKGHSRNYGIHSERCFYDSGIGKNFGTIEVEDGQLVRRGRTSEKSKPISPIQAALRNFYWLKETGENYVQYLKYTGQNAHIMGCYQYCEYNTPNVFSTTIEDSRALNCPKSMYAHMFDLNDIDIYAGVEFSQSQDVKTYANNAQVAMGAESAYMIDEKGRQIYGFFVSFLQNWLHPETQQKYCFLMERLGRTYGHLEHFKGIHNFTGIDTRAGGYWMPGMSFGSRYDNPLRISYDDITMELFEKETGIHMGISKSDTLRFEKRAKFLETNEEAKTMFLSWRSDKFRDLVAKSVTALRKESRPDVDMFNVLQMPDFRLFQYLYSAGKSAGEVSKEMGYDIPKVNSIDGVWTGRWTIGWRHWYPRPPHRNPFTWMARTDPSVISAFESDSNRFVFVRTSWDENVFDEGRIRVMPQPGGYNCREAFIQAIITGDPELLVGGYTDLNINVGYEHTLRGIFHPFVLLPKEKFTEVLSTGLTTNVAIRQLNKDDQSWFYIANPCQWEVSGSITFEEKADIYNLVTGEIVKLKGKRLNFTLEPFGLLAYRSTSPEMKIIGYNTDPISKEDYARLSGAINKFKDNFASNDLPAEDRAFLESFIMQIDKYMKSQEYAKAWSFFTEPRVWTLKTKLEQ